MLPQCKFFTERGGLSNRFSTKQRCGQHACLADQAQRGGNGGRRRSHSHVWDNLKLARDTRSKGIAKSAASNSPSPNEWGLRPAARWRSSPLSAFPKASWTGRYGGIEAFFGRLETRPRRTPPLRTSLSAEPRTPPPPRASAARTRPDVQVPPLSVSAATSAVSNGVPSAPVFACDPPANSAFCSSYSAAVSWRKT